MLNNGSILTHFGDLATLDTLGDSVSELRTF